MNSIEKTCGNCEYELEGSGSIYCRHCVCIATDNFVPKESIKIAQESRNKAIDEFANTLISSLTDAIYQKDVESMSNLINDAARELKDGGKE